MRISARRLALIVLGAAVLNVALVFAIQIVYQVRGGGGLELGFATSMLYGLLSFLWPFLVVDAGVLAIRRRRATRAEIIVLIVLGGVVAILALVASLEPVLMTMGFPGQIAVLAVSAFAWAPMGAAALAGLVVIIVQTIRAVRFDPAGTDAPPAV